MNLRKAKKLFGAPLPGPAETIPRAMARRMWRDRRLRRMRVLDKAIRRALRA